MPDQVKTPPSRPGRNHAQEREAASHPSIECAVASQSTCQLVHLSTFRARPMVPCPVATSETTMAKRSAVFLRGPTRRRAMAACRPQVVVNSGLFCQVPHHHKPVLADAGKAL